MHRVAITLLVGAVFCLIIATGCEKEYENYQKGTARAKQVEAQLALQQLKAAQVGYKSLNGRYGETFEEIGFSMIEENQRYSYFMGDDVLEGATFFDEFPGFLKYPEVTDSNFIAYAIANLDDDPDLDVWRVTNAGNPKQVRNDR